MRKYKIICTKLANAVYVTYYEIYLYLIYHK